MTITIALTGQALIHQPLRVEGRQAEEVLDFLKADATIGNFEGVVEAPRAWPTKTKTVHAVEKSVIGSLAKLGFSAMAHANNHAFDLGPPGIVATHTALRGNKIALAGSGLNLAGALRPVDVMRSRRKLVLFSVDLGPQPEIVYAGEDRAGIAPLRVVRSTRLSQEDYAVIRRIHESVGDAARLASRRKVGYSPPASEGVEAFGAHFMPGDGVEAVWRVDSTDWQRLTVQIRTAKDKGKIVVLALHNHHWDADWTQTPAWFDRLTEDLVDAGADVILGTGAPVMQPMRIYRDRAILSGLGNFIFHTARPGTYDDQCVDVWRSAAVRLGLDEEGHCLQYEVLPIAVSRPTETGMALSPRPLNGEEADQVHARFRSRL